MTEDKKKLPDGWKWVKLGDVCEINPSRSANFKRADDEITTFVPMQAVDGNLGIIAQPEIKPYKEVRKGYTYFAENDVIFAKISPCMENGKYAIATDLIDGIGFGTTEFHVIRAKQEITSEWIHKFLRQPKIRKLASEHFIGSVGQQRVPKEFLINLYIPLPPLSEQKRIAAILNEQMAAVTRARIAAEARLEAAKKLPSAYLREVFESDEAKGWERKRLGDITQTCSGGTPLRDYPEYYKGDIPWVKTGELRDNIIEDTEEHINQKALSETSLKLLPAETLLIAMYGQGQTRGRTGLLAKPATINQACFAILPNKKEFLPLYLQWWFRYKYTALRQDTEKRGGNQPNLNGELLRNQQILLPSLSEQKRIVAYLTEKLTECDRLKQSLTEQLAAINQLPAALLRRAFNGDI